MKATTKRMPESVKQEVLTAIAAAVDLLPPHETAEMIRRLGRGIDVRETIGARRRAKQRWEFFRRVSRWVHGEEDQELDRWAKIG